ncbi:DUF4041 domain-containing protein [Krasilnikovia sp. MM14-A1259]|uniref:DUF4041 domain-containing protein n=1 Tax=Krasilnikovia sp. MM14-A1259 TaxID=3373539 RepID=UPI00382DDBA7
MSPFVFVVPPTWPQPPDGWTPPPWWKPDPAWPPPPQGWQFWQPRQGAAASPGRPLPARTTNGGLFGGGRRKVLAVEIASLQSAVSELRRDNDRLTGEKNALQTETERLSAAMADKDLVARDNHALRGEIERLSAAVDATNAELRRLLGMDPAAVRDEAFRLLRERETARLQQRAALIELTELQQQLVPVQEAAMLQEAGLYEYVHPLDDAIAYKSRLDHLKEKIKSMARGNTAVQATTSWLVNGSERDGMAMVRDFSKLMLRAYNAEADNCIRTVRPHRLHAVMDRLTKVRDTIARLGKTMDIEIASDYHQARIKEIRLTADYLGKVEEEKERVRAQRERQREEDRAQREFEREKARLIKERAHYQAVLARMHTQGDTTSAAQLEDKLVEIAGAIHGVEQREANIRAGYVYVISNIGAFGPDMVKIGMTRRLEPTDRIRELGDASVPFRFDTHALIFSEDAVGLESRLHQALAGRKVNLVNQQREFFYAAPAEVRDVLANIAGQHLLEYHEVPEALEWHASRRDRCDLSLDGRSSGLPALTCAGSASTRV